MKAHWEGATDRVEEAFAKNLREGADVGAAVAAWRDGEVMFSYFHGWRDAGRSEPWDRDTIVLIWSATKGLASTCLLHALDEAGLNLSTVVAGVWPEFGQTGKSDITMGEVASHRAGLAALADRTAPMLDHDAVVRAIETQAPLWRLGEGHGYGPRTYGFVADEIVRRITGETLGAYWRKHFGDPLKLDAWIGLPEHLHDRAAQILAARMSPNEPKDEFAEAMAQPDSITRAAFTTPAGMLSPSGMNTTTARTASIPSFGALASAHALAKFYGMLAQGGTWERKTYVSQKVLEWMTTPLAQGWDKTLQTETAFSAGFMMDPVDTEGKKKRKLFGPSAKAFGHPGAGGSLGFADPENGIGFAYVMNQMETGVLPKARAWGLVEALYDFA